MHDINSSMHIPIANHYRTIVVSDVHLGTKGSKAKEVVRFLKLNTADNLILNGDIIDGWQLKKSGEWKRKHTKFFQRVLKMMSDHNTKVTYLRGNHDDFLEQIMPLTIGNLTIKRDIIYVGATGKKYIVTHGDIFDSVTSKWTWLAHIGDIGYTFLLWLNRVYNKYREWRGLNYFSLSKLIKSKVKSAVSYISSYEEKLVQLAKAKNCQGVICGHIHQPIITQYDDITYLNSGDWVESLSALVEDFNGEWNLIFFTETTPSVHEKISNHEDDNEDDDNEELPTEFIEYSKRLIPILQ